MRSFEERKAEIQRRSQARLATCLGVRRTLGICLAMSVLAVVTLTVVISYPSQPPSLTAPDTVIITTTSQGEVCVTEPTSGTTTPKSTTVFTTAVSRVTVTPHTATGAPVRTTVSRRTTTIAPQTTTAPLVSATTNTAAVTQMTTVVAQTTVPPTVTTTTASFVTLPVPPGSVDMGGSGDMGFDDVGGGMEGLGSTTTTTTTTTTNTTTTTATAVTP